MIGTLIGGVRLLQRDRWRRPVLESDARTASKRAAPVQEAGAQYRADKPADLPEPVPIIRLRITMPPWLWLRLTRLTRRPQQQHGAE